jgi:hypothetical protein
MEATFLDSTNQRPNTRLSIYLSCERSRRDIFCREELMAHIAMPWSLYPTSKARFRLSVRAWVK